MTICTKMTILGGPMKERSLIEYLNALDKAHEDPESRKIIEQLIYSHIGMIKHMKTTHLWDIFEYERGLVEPMRIFVLENKDLKKEVNQLRKKLGMCEKYNIEEDEED